MSGSDAFKYKPYNNTGNDDHREIRFAIRGSLIFIATDSPKKSGK